jgi:hypothetical protein
MGVLVNFHLIELYGSSTAAYRSFTLAGQLFRMFDECLYNPKSPLPFSQQPATDFCLGPNKFSPAPPTLRYYIDASTVPSSVHMKRILISGL